MELLVGDGDSKKSPDVAAICLIARTDTWMVPQGVPKFWLGGIMASQPTPM